jgi:hypothetical protein
MHGLKTPKLEPAKNHKRSAADDLSNSPHETSSMKELEIRNIFNLQSSMRELEIPYYYYYDYYGSLLCLHSQLALGEEWFTPHWYLLHLLE